MLTHECQCRKLKMGRVSFSPTTKLPKQQIIFWTLVIKQRKGGRVSSNLCSCKKAHAGITEAVGPLALFDLASCLHQAQQDYCLAKQKHVASRESFLTSLGTKDSAWILRAEKQWALCCAAKHVPGKLNSLLVTKVIFEGEELSERRDVKLALLHVNEAKIWSSESTPFLQEPLLSALGVRNKTSATNEVLCGTFHIPPSINLYMSNLLCHLTAAFIPPNVQPFQPCQIITTLDNTKTWAWAKERTSAGISGLHFGMFKAHASSPYLSFIDAAMRSIAYSTGFSYAQ